jgi:hypothetical protein
MSEVMLFQGLVATTSVFPDAAQGCLDGEKCPRSDFGLDLRPVFQWPHVQPQEQDQLNRRLSFRKGLRTKPFLGGSDPALSGLAAAQRLRRQGSLPPKLSSRFPRSVAGKSTGREPNEFESLIAKEMKRWP